MAHAGRGGSGRRAPRLGPRPLPLHLATASLTWLSSRAALPLWSSGSPARRPELPAEAGRRWHADLAARSSLRRSRPRSSARLRRRARPACRRASSAIAAIPTAARSPEPPVALARRHARGCSTTAPAAAGAAAGAAGRALADQPRLYPRSAAERSLLRFLAGAGLRPLLLDWGAPGEPERGFTLTDYIAGRLEAALDRGRRAAAGRSVAARLLHGRRCWRWRWRCAGRAISPAWRCWRRPGISMPSGRSRRTLLGALAEPARAAAAQRSASCRSMRSRRSSPASIRSGDPQVPRLRRARSGRRERARLFVALEDWLNDGVPLAAAGRARMPGRLVRRQHAGARAHGGSPGEPVRPRALDLPSAGRDAGPGPHRAAGARPWRWPRRCRGAAMLRPAAGHIGMMVGGGAAERLWRPLAAWLPRPDPRSLAAARGLDLQADCAPPCLRERMPAAYRRQQFSRKSPGGVTP